MKLKHLTPTNPLLRSYIRKHWYFESDVPIPRLQNDTTVPNGLPKLIFVLKGDLIADDLGRIHRAVAGEVVLTGVHDYPVGIFSTEPHTAFGFELNPQGAASLFRLNMSEMKNRIGTLEEIIGPSARALMDRALNARTLNETRELIENFLLSFVQQASPRQELATYAINAIRESRGLITVADLAKRTGYSTRYVNRIFDEAVGVSPKLLSQIEKFQVVFQNWAIRKDSEFIRDHIYDFYYDQAHFVKEFRRFTGLAPLSYAKFENEFGTLFYRG